MQFYNILVIKNVALLLSAYSVLAHAQNTKIYSVTGDINVAFLLNDCRNVTEALTYSQNSILNAAIWTTDRINYLEMVSPLTLGLSVYQSCSELDFLKRLFDHYQNDQNYILSLMTIKKPSDKVKKFSDVLDIRTKTLKRYYNFLIKATVQFLRRLDWRENVTVVTTDEAIMELFYKYSKSARICIKECYIFESAESITLNATGEDPLVFFGTAADINQLMMNDPHWEDKYAADDIRTVFVPLDGDVPTEHLMKRLEDLEARYTQQGEELAALKEENANMKNANAPAGGSNNEPAFNPPRQGYGGNPVVLPGDLILPPPSLQSLQRHDNVAGGFKYKSYKPNHPYRKRGIKGGGYQASKNLAIKGLIRFINQ